MPKLSAAEIENKLRDEIALMLCLDAEKISADTSLQELGLDSLTLVELFVFIEKNFAFKLMESGITKDDLRTVGALAKRIAQ